MLCSNFDGTEVLLPFVICKSEKPRCFGGRQGHEMGIDYANSRRGWMTRTLFYHWLLRFDYHASLTPGRRVALLVDNASCHVYIDVLPSLYVVISGRPLNLHSAKILSPSVVERR